MSPATVKVHTLLQGHPLSTDQGHVAFCGVNLLEGLDEQGVMRRILIDTGHVGRRLVLEQALDRRGLAPADVDVLVLTHAHFDHIENLDLFEAAKVVLHANERRYATMPHRNDWACPPWIEGLLERCGERLQEVAEGTSLIPGVEIVDAPGHSAGSIAVTAKTDKGTAVFTGDSIQNAMSARERRNGLIFWDEEQSRQTIDKLVAIADVIYPGHDLAFRLGADNVVEYLDELRVTVFDASLGRPGVVLGEGAGVRQWVMPGIEEQRLRLPGGSRRGPPR